MSADLTTRTSAENGTRLRIPHAHANLRLQAGQSLLEFALVTPLLLALLIGGIELGRYAYIGILVGNAARAGAAFGSQGLVYSAQTGNITAAAVNDFQNNGQTGLAVTSSTSCGCDSGGTTTSAVCSTSISPSAGTCGSGHWVVMVSVTASGTFTALFNYPGVPPSITVSRTSTMRVENR
jgi:Flp pilus assembly protein TadG